MKQIRLQKYIADCGITSRRKAELLILDGEVKVNGVEVVVLGTKVSPGEDVVSVRGEIIDRDAIDHVYVVLNKPRGVVSTLNDPEGRRTVIDFCKGVTARIYPVGRLDYLSEGLLILTNDGEFTHKILHPSYEITKVYEVKIFGNVNESIIRKLRGGIQVGNEFLKPKSVRVIKQLQTKTWLEFRLTEGKNREIRKLAEACGLTIDKLKRVAIGELSLRGLKPGDYAVLSRSEILKMIGLDKNIEKLNREVEYTSHKKSVPKRKRDKFKPKRPMAADAETFQIFRKENYNQTITRRKEYQAKLNEELNAKLKAQENTQLSNESVSTP